MQLANQKKLLHTRVPDWLPWTIGLGLIVTAIAFVVWELNAPPPDPPPVLVDEFNSIELGMTEAEVTKILGERGWRGEKKGT